MNPNTDPIYSRVGRIKWSQPLLLAANDYSCISNANQEVFEADEINGGICTRLRFKAEGTNIATVARIYINNGLPNQQIITASGTPAGTPATSGGTIQAGNHYAKIVPVGQGGDVGAASTESSAVNCTDTTGLNSIAWTWTAPQFTVAAYRLHIGLATGVQGEYFWVPASTVVAQMSGTTTMTVTGITSAPDARICKALGPGVVFASGPTAGDYIVAQLTSTESDGALGRNGTYQMSTARTFGPGAAVTDPLKYQQICPIHSMMHSFDGGPTLRNSVLYGEISLPATNASAAVATADIDYPFPPGFALSPGYAIYVGLGTAVAGGWSVSAPGGAY